MNGRRDILSLELTPEEGRAIRQRAHDAGLTLSNYIRRCINSTLLEEGDDSPLLEERHAGGRRGANGQSC